MRFKIKNLLASGGTLSQKVVKGAFWVGLFKVLERTLRFARKIVVARLLSPKDFGLFGLACLAMGVLETFTQTGMHTALIQRKEKTEEFLDTAWTINLIRGIILSFSLYLLSPYIAKFFNNEEVLPFVKIISLILLINGIKNIGAIYFIKELEFRKQFILQIGKTLVDIGVCITLAFILKNAWALVWGMFAGSIAQCFLSYILHPYRPKIRFEKEKAKELLNFGKWILGSSILIFLLTQGDDILVGKILGLTALGLYQMAYTIANLPATEITHVISQVTFPAYSKLQDNLPKLREAYLKVLQLTAFISFPIAGLIFALAPDFTKLFLGEKWMPMVPAMQILVIGGAIRSIGATIGPIFQGIGRPDILTKSMFAQLLILAVSIYPLIFKLGITGASIAVVIPGLIVNTFLFYRINMIIKNKLRVSLTKISYAFLATLFMIFWIFVVKKFLNDQNYLIINFTLEVVLGAIALFFIVFLLEKFFEYRMIALMKEMVKKW